MAAAARAGEVIDTHNATGLGRKVVIRVVREVGL
jgi:hypothetical protein